MYASFATMFCYSGLSFAVSRRALAIAKGLIRPGNVRDVFTCASMDFIHHYLARRLGDAFVIDEGLVEEALRCGQLWDVNTYLGLYCDRRLRQGDFAGRPRVARAARRHERQLRLHLRRRQPRRHDGAAAARGAPAGRGQPPPPRNTPPCGTRTRCASSGSAPTPRRSSCSAGATAAERSLAAAERITSRSIEVPPWHLSAYAAARLRHQVALLEDAIARRRLDGGHRLARAPAASAMRCGSPPRSRSSARRSTSSRDASGGCSADAHARCAPGSARSPSARRWGRGPSWRAPGRVAGESLADGGGRLLGLDGAACLARSLDMLQALGLEREAEHARQRTARRRRRHRRRCERAEHHGSAGRAARSVGRLRRTRRPDRAGPRSARRRTIVVPPRTPAIHHAIRWLFRSALSRLLRHARRRLRARAPVRPVRDRAEPRLDARLGLRLVLPALAGPLPRRPHLLGSSAARHLDALQRRRARCARDAPIRRAIRLACAVLAAGEPLIVFPEGQISRAPAGHDPRSPASCTSRRRRRRRSCPSPSAAPSRPSHAGGACRAPGA